MTDNKIDEYAEDCFKAIGCKDPLPKELVSLYTRVKRIRDRLTPGRLSVDTLALIVVLAADEISKKEQGE